MSQSTQNSLLQITQMEKNNYLIAKKKKKNKDKNLVASYNFMTFLKHTFSLILLSTAGTLKKVD